MRIIHTPEAPDPVGPYSQAIEIHGMVYTAGQVGLDPATGKIVDGGFEAQARQVLKNLTAVLKAAGCTWNDVVKTTIYLQNMTNFPVLNRLYGEAVGDHRPARSTTQAAALPLGAEVEIDLIARVPG